jgi:AcrR family transcriptional regulator
MSSFSGRKASIQTAARHLFAGHGYEATSMRAIAEEADVSVGLAYNYFDSKADLLRAIVQTGIAQIQDTFDALDGPAAPETRLERFVHASLDTVRANRELWQVLYRLRQQPAAQASIQSQIDAITEVIFVRLTALMTELGSSAPEADARLLFAAIDGTAQHVVRDPSTYPLDAVADRLVERFRRQP